MTLLKQFIIWMKSIAFGSVFTILLSAFIFRSALPVPNLIYGILVIFFYALLLTIPMQIILYFLANKDFRKERKTSSITLPIMIFYWIVLFGCLYFVLASREFFSVFIVLLISFVPINILQLYKGITE